MIVTQTPFRITLGGGGTDLRPYYSKHGGIIVSVAINKFMYIFLNTPFDKKIRIKYSKSEVVDKVEELEHKYAGALLNYVGIKESIDVVSLADIPAGTGLGSSSCYAVGMLNGLYTLKNNVINLKELAEKVCNLEMNIMNLPVGKQDQYMATFGGLTHLDINNNGEVIINKLNISEDNKKTLNRNLILLYTNTVRDSNIILKEQSENIESNNKIVNMHCIKDIGYKILDAINTSNFDDIGILFDEHWNFKKKMSTKMTNPLFDKLYNIATKNGALGGKISGAGGGGFFLFYVPTKHEEFINHMTNLGLRHIDYKFESFGTKVITNA